MSRPLRIEFPGATYHVMNRGLATQAIFTTPADRLTFLEGLGEVHARWGLRVFAYCLMRTHYHLCVQTPQVPLSRVMRHLDGVYTQRYNRRHGRDGPLFRGRYRAILVEADRYLLAVVRYVHQNPVTAGAGAQPERYPWSSLRAYLTAKGRPAWLDTQTVRAAFQGQRSAFLAFMRAQPEAELTAFYRAGRAAPILGTETFKARIRARRRRDRSDREVPERRHLAVPVEACLRAVARAYGVPTAQLGHSQRGVTNRPRQVAMYVCREVGGYSHREIGERFRAGSYSTVSSVCTMLKARLREDRDLQRRLARIRRALVG